MENYFKEMFEEIMLMNKDGNANSMQIDSNLIVLPIGTMHQMENEIIRNLYRKFDGDKKTIERTLDISSTTVWRRVKELFEEPRMAPLRLQESAVAEQAK